MKGPVDLSGDVHLWVASSLLDEGCDLAWAYREMLSEEELAREKRFHFERDRSAFLVTRAMVRTVLSRYRPVEPRNWRFARNEHGRPSIVDETATRVLSFNVSHSDGLVTLVVGGQADLGVDVENTARDSRVRELSERFFARREWSQLKSLPEDEQDARFYALWTLKEAYVKARGRGLSIPPHRYAFDLAWQGGIRLDVDPALGDAAEHWQFWQLGLAPRHVVAVCVRQLAGAYCRLVCRETVPLVSETPFDPVMLRTSTGLCS